MTVTLESDGWVMGVASGRKGGRCGRGAAPAPPCVQPRLPGQLGRMRLPRLFGVQNETNVTPRPRPSVPPVCLSFLSTVPSATALVQVPFLAWAAHPVPH